VFSSICPVTDTDGLGAEAMVRVFITIMFGAFDTTSAGMTSMAYLLAKHPEWQERLHAEAKAIQSVSHRSARRTRSTAASTTLRRGRACVRRHAALQHGDAAVLAPQLTSCTLRLTRDYEARHTFTPMGVVSGDVRLTLGLSRT